MGYPYAITASLISSWYYFFKIYELQNWRNFPGYLFPCMQSIDVEGYLTLRMGGSLSVGQQLAQEQPTAATLAFFSSVMPPEYVSQMDNGLEGNLPADVIEI